MADPAAPVTAELMPVSASAAPAEAKTKQQKQLALNMAFYEGVYKQALSSAEKLLTKEGKVPEPQDLLQIADTLFSQFCSDQMDVQREKAKQAQLDKQLAPLMSFLSSKGIM